jgi:isopentenyl-diphosphate Delta-isomerase
MRNDHVILVDAMDNAIGIMPKLEAHEKGILHRAFSVFILNENNEVMLQQRAASKYHSPNLWSNTCCSHPQEGETNIEAGQRRLQEEMGFLVDLEEAFSFIYKAEFENGLIEHELDYVLVGKYTEMPTINAAEVSDWKWMNIAALQNDIITNSNDYTIWFRIVFEEFCKYNNLN